jgi:hypothetical protein
MDYLNREEYYKKHGINIREFDEINNFFRNLKAYDMPNLLRYLILDKNGRIFFKLEELETEVKSSSELKNNFFPEIIKKFPEFFKKQEEMTNGLISDIIFPGVCRNITEQLNEHFIYHPETGKFIGEYRVRIPF